MPKPIKLYFALLNHGWIRNEVAAHQLPQMKNTPGVELWWEQPWQTWHHPIYSNRNKIVKRFLMSDCDFLMMQDDDVIPMGHNPAELVFADKDIIGCPAKVRGEGGTLDWVAYAMRDDLGGYVTIDMSRAPTTADLLKVDIVGTGLIIIKRRVLEAIKAPFLVENDEDGVCTWGTDFAFCKRAGAAGFEVYTTPHRICEHIKEIGFNSLSGYDDSDSPDESNYDYKIAWGGWAIQQRDWAFIKKAMEDNGVKRVVEFGAGLSSLLMSERAKVVSYETRQDWIDTIAKKKIEGRNDLEFRLWDGVTLPDLGEVGPMDMVFVDGPPAATNGGVGRKVSYEAASKSGAKFIITHDSGRQEELGFSDMFLRPKYDIAGKNGNHQQRSVLWRLREA
ncbi:MAG: hypothetical protein MZV70_03590 [Desulfobacterales bacterium]|nr:hypothetical protein [Desulfobacterales bacterium]